MNRPKKLLMAGLALACVAALAGVAYAVVGQSDPTDQECRDELVDALTDDTGLSEECAAWMGARTADLQMQADLITECKQAVEQQHSERWTVPLEFDSADVEETAEDEYRVTGEAHFITGTGDRNDRTYRCTMIAADGDIGMRTAALD